MNIRNIGSDYVTTFLWNQKLRSMVHSNISLSHMYLKFGGNYIDELIENKVLNEIIEKYLLSGSSSRFFLSSWFPFCRETFLLVFTEVYVAFSSFLVKPS